MRLDARKGDVGYFVWDVKRCCVPRHVLWVEEETALWGQLLVPVSLFSYEPPVRLYQEDRITVYLEIRLVLFNEIEDGDSTDVLDVLMQQAAERSST